MKRWFFVSFWAVKDGKNQIGNCDFQTRIRRPGITLIRQWEEAIKKNSDCESVTLIDFHRIARRKNDKGGQA
jgi:hypothetical protein